MPQKLKTFEFKSFGSGKKHDWATLLDGSIYQLTKGEDYDCEDQTMRMMAYKAGRTMGKQVKVAACEGGVVIQAEDATEEQIAEWNVTAEATKAKQKEKRDAAKAEKEAGKGADTTQASAARENTAPAKPAAKAPPVTPVKKK